MNIIEGNFAVDGRNLRYDAAGAGAPLVFVHGSAGSRRQWKRLFAHFARTRLVFAYDLIGCGDNRPLAIDAFHGEDPALDDRPFSYLDDARALCAVVDRFGEPVDVVAHSAGGIGALLAALERPAAIRTLTVFEPTPFVLLRDNAEPSFDAIREIAMRYRLLVERSGPAVAMEAFVDFWNGPGSWQRLSEGVRRSMLAGAGRLYREWGVILYGRPFLRLDALARLKQPTLYFCGSETIRPARRLAELATERLPSCRLVSIAGAGHMAPFTHGPNVLPDIERHVAHGHGTRTEAGEAPGIPRADSYRQYAPSTGR